jgi:hypothetical protein
MSNKTEVKMDNGNIVVTYAHIQEAFDKNPDQFQQSLYQLADKAANGDPIERAHLIAMWTEALTAFKLEKGSPGVMSTPRNAMVSRLQTMLAAQAGQAGKLSTIRPAQPIVTPAGGQSSVPKVDEVKFDNEDLFGWLGMAWKFIFKPDRHPWIVPPTSPQTIADDARIALFADWGTGLYGAPVIAKSIVGLDRCDVVLHLGDTYYSGAKGEVANRLVGDWPVRGGNTVNRTLNGNHEMYSGGQGYFESLESFFHQPASCFAMQNSNWILVCLDTAYKDFDLDSAQVAWLKSIVDAAGARKLLLFSHHQPFSQLDVQGPNLQRALADILSKQRIHGWFWGHEHRLVLYDTHSAWGFKGRCIGHGGFPAVRDGLTPPRNIYQWVDVPKQPSGVPAAKVLDGPNFWVAEDPMKYSPHGFVTLDFDGDKVWETYYTPDHISVTARMLL